VRIEFLRAFVDGSGDLKQGEYASGLVENLRAKNRLKVFGGRRGSSISGRAELAPNVSKPAAEVVVLSEELVVVCALTFE